MEASDLDDVPLDHRADAGDAEPWRMLHPASVLVNLVPRAWGVVQQLWPLFLVAIAGGTFGGQGLVDLSMIVMFFAYAAATTAVHFFTLRYRLANGRLEIRSGLLSTNRRVIAPRAVQNIELVRNIFHRMTGLVEIRIETASGDDVEGLLSALNVEEGERLIAALSRARKATERSADTPVLAENSVADLLLFGATQTRFGAALVAFGVLSQWSGVFDPSTTQDLTTRLGALGIGLLILALLLGAWVVGVVSAIVRHHGFRMSTVGDALVAEEGLFTRRRVELPRHKVQLIRWSEPWLRRIVGIGSFTIESASAGSGVAGTERTASSVPVVRAEEAAYLVHQAFEHLDLTLDGADWSGADPRARTRALLIGAVQGLVAWIVALSMGVGVFSVLLALLSPLPLLTGWLDWRAQAWTVSGRFVAARRGFFDRTTTVVSRSRIQSVQVFEGPWLRAQGLAQIVVRVAGSVVVMPLVDAAYARELANLLSLEVARR